MYQGRGVIVFFALLLLAAAVSLPSCSRADEPDKDRKLTVALVVKMKHGDFWRTVKLGAESAAKEQDVNLNFYAPDYEEDAKGQLALVRQALRDGADAMILAPNDPSVLAEVLAITKQGGANFPVITMDSSYTSPELKSVVGTDNLEAGKQAAEKLIDLVEPQGRIVVLGTSSGAMYNGQREQGVLGVLDQRDQINKVVKAYSLNDAKSAAEKLRQLLQEYGDLRGIVALNAVLAVGAAEEIQQQGLEGKVKLVAIDSPPEVLEFLQEGVIQATVIQKPFSMGYLGVTYAVEAWRGKTIPGRVDTGTKVIDLENMFWSENQKLLFPFVK